MDDSVESLIGWARVEYATPVGVRLSHYRKPDGGTAESAKVDDLAAWLDREGCAPLFMDNGDYDGQWSVDAEDDTGHHERLGKGTTIRAALVAAVRQIAKAQS